jgi:hypothetical protein
MTRLIKAKEAWNKFYAAFAAESMVFLIAYLAIIVGLPIVFDPTIFAPASVQSGLTEVAARVWGMGLFGGGLLTAYGLGAERPRIERAGLALLIPVAIIYAMVIVGSAGWAAILPALTYALFAWSSFARYRKLGQVLSGIELAKRIENGDS